MSDIEPQAGTVIDGKYELVERCGEGGMATVWRGVLRGAAGFTRPIALKRIKSEYRAIKKYQDMFIEEARVGSELQHPNIVQVFDFCVGPDNAYYLVMEWVEGLDLGRLVRLASKKGELLAWPLVASIG